jgi:alkyl hydroperoxide reductase subunit AhpC
MTAETFLGSTIDISQIFQQELSMTKMYFFIIYLETNECIPCSLQKVTLLDHYKGDFEKFNTQIILVTRDDEKKKEEIKKIFSDMNIRYPLFFDKDDYFVKQNPIILSTPNCKAFIIDKNNKVIWVGYPIETAQSIERYRKMMSLLLRIKKK